MGRVRGEVGLAVRDSNRPPQQSTIRRVCSRRWLYLTDDVPVRILL